MKNDVSFVIDCNMCLYEHQSTYSPNLPLRGFFYFSDLYKKLVKDVDLTVRKLIKIPTPHYIVFYNGLENKEEEFTLKLSDKCSSLYGYSYFVALVRKYLDEMELEDAVNTAVDECIEANILKDFLLEHKAEVVAMSIYEYNEEYVRKSFFEDGVETGYNKGYDKGYDKGGAQQLIKNVETVMSNLKVDLDKSCEILGITLEEYEKAKNAISH